MDLRAIESARELERLLFSDPAGDGEPLFRNPPQLAALIVEDGKHYRGNPKSVSTLIGSVCSGRRNCPAKLKDAILTVARRRLKASHSVHETNERVHRLKNSIEAFQRRKGGTTSLDEDDLFDELLLRVEAAAELIVCGSLLPNLLMSHQANGKLAQLREGIYTKLNLLKPGGEMGSGPPVGDGNEAESLPTQPRLKVLLPLGTGRGFWSLFAERLAGDTGAAVDEGGDGALRRLDREGILQVVEIHPDLCARSEIVADPHLLYGMSGYTLFQHRDERVSVGQIDPFTMIEWERNFYRPLLSPAGPQDETVVAVRVPWKA